MFEISFIIFRESALFVDLAYCWKEKKPSLNLNFKGLVSFITYLLISN